MMKRVVACIIFLVTLVSARAGITISSVDSTASVCFNDGSIIINPTGGSPPYTYSITSGPSVPNVTYPINGGTINTFNDLHAGTYTVKVSDQSGHTLNVTVTVPGSYQFPVATFTTHQDSMFAYGSLGKPPYKFAISTVSANGPFGPYQSSNVFAGLCNGTYYLRVFDSCQNFYTIPFIINTPPLQLAGFCQSGGPNSNLITTSTFNTGSPPYSYRLVNGSFTNSNTTGVFNVPSTDPCPDTIYVTDLCHATAQTIVDCHPLAASLCSNFSDSTASVTASGGTLPYTYTFYQYISGQFVPLITQANGFFNHLPYNNINETVGFGVTDACGRTILPATLSDFYTKINYLAPCPFNDSVYVSVTGIFTPGTITCVNCSPTQTQSLPDAVFFVPDTGTYTLRSVDACGETRDTIIHVPNQPISAVLSRLSCNSVRITSPDTTNIRYILYVLNTVTNQLDSVTQNTSGYFIHLPNGSYQVKVATPTCFPTKLNFSVPWFNSYCTLPYLDNNCTLKMIIDYGTPASDFPENYSLHSGSGVILNEDPLGGGNGIFFNISPGTYTLISDSGCSITQSFTYDFQLGATTTHSCIDQSTVTLGAQNVYFNYCSNPALEYVLQNGNLIYRDSALYGGPVTFTNVPPGNYLASVYFLNDSVYEADTLRPTGNRHCPLDTLTVQVLAHTEPIIHAHNVNVCGAHTLGNIPFTITGGFPPYIVSIVGQSTTTTDSANGILPGIQPDSTYTMRVSDSCGISSTFSVSVIDTCDITNCSFVKATFTVDSNACQGSSISFQNTFTSGTTYLWTANGVVFSTSPNPVFTAINLGNIVFKCVVTYSTLCKDSFTATVQVDKAPAFHLGPDTFYCGNFSRVLSSGVLGTHWSNGITDSSITVSLPGTYTASISNGCGVYVDSVVIGEKPLPVVSLVGDTTVCTGDSAVLNAFFTGASYHWSNNSTSDSIVVSQSGLYIVTVSLATCSTIDSTNFSAVTITANQLLPADTVLCSGRPLIIKPTAGTNAVWQDGTHDSVYVVTSAGVYTVTAKTVCGTFTDSVTVVAHATPTVNLGPDSLLCNGDSIVLHAFFPNSTYTWNTGSTSDSIVVNIKGEYVVTVNSFGCKTTDSVHFETAVVSHNLLPGDTTLCEGTTLVLIPGAGTNPVWQDGSHNPEFTVSQPGLYTVMVNTICGDYRDSLKVAYEICPSNLHVPDAFTPNGDGINDYFTVYGESIAAYDIKIFNRWGEVVYDSRNTDELNNMSRGWDGTYKGKIQDPASFTYLITAKGYDSKDYVKTGYVILIR